MHGGHFSALMRDLKPSVKPIISTETAMRVIGRDRTRTVSGVGSRRATAQPEVKIASSKPSMTLSADQNRLIPTFGGIPSGAFQVPQFVRTKAEYSKSRAEHSVKC